MKHFRYFIYYAIFALMLGTTVLPGSSAFAQTPYQFKIFVPVVQGGSSQAAQAAGLPSLDEFADSLKNEQASQVRGVYVADTLALQVVQQPAGNNEYVALQPGAVTQFDLARLMGVTGFLAHNNLAGKLFFGLVKEQQVSIIYGDGAIRLYKIVRIDRYQALSPTSASSAFQNLASGEVLSAAEIFLKYYTGSDQVTFQTCIALGDNSSWGRLFVVAIPLF